MANKVGSIHSVVNVVGLFLIVIIKAAFCFTITGLACCDLHNNTINHTNENAVSN